MMQTACLTLADRLYRTKYEPDSEHPHIRLAQELCRTCTPRPCLHVCPAGVYRLSPEDPGKVTVSHDNCLECGTCRRICPHAAIDWRFPDGGLGVRYRFG